MDEIRPDTNGEPTVDEPAEEMPGEDPAKALFAEAQHALDYGENREAAELFEELISMLAEPEAQHYNKLGIAYARMERMDDAREAFEAALDEDGQFVPALSNLGNIYFSDGDLEAAEDYYNRAIKNDPDYGTAYNNLAAVYKKQGKIGESIKAMKKSQRLALKNPPKSYYEEPGSGRRRRGLLGCFGSGLLVVLATAAVLLLITVLG